MPGAADSEFFNFCNIMQDRAGEKKLLVDKGVYVTHALCEPHDGKGVAQQTSPDCMVQLKGRWPIEQLLFIFIEKLCDKLL